MIISIVIFNRSVDLRFGSFEMYIKVLNAYRKFQNVNRLKDKNFRGI